jgi:hypothetical protein
VKGYAEKKTTKCQNGRFVISQVHLPDYLQGSGVAPRVKNTKTPGVPGLISDGSEIRQGSQGQGWETGVLWRDYPVKLRSGSANIQWMFHIGQVGKPARRTSDKI